MGPPYHSRSRGKAGEDRAYKGGDVSGAEVPNG